MVEVKRLEVRKPHLGSYRNVGDGYENQQFFRISLRSLVASDVSRKQEYLRHRVEKAEAVKSGSSMPSPQSSWEVCVDAYPGSPRLRTQNRTSEELIQLRESS